MKKTAPNERTLPHNEEAERSVLGAVLVHNNAYEHAAQVIRATDFYRDAHRRIFAAMGALIDERRVVVDFVTLREELARSGDLDEVGGPAYVSSLADGVPRSTNIAYYAQIVKEKAQLRSIIESSNRTLTAAYDAEESSTAILQAADRAILGLQNGHGGGRLTDLRSSSAALFADVEYSVAHKGELRGLNTGFDSINQLTFGWQAGDLTVIAARPSIGKSTFALNTAVAAAQGGARVAIFSLEMRRRQLERRLLSSLSGVDLQRIVGGYLGSADYGKISAALQVIHDLPISIDDRGGQTFWDIRSACRRMRSEGGLGMVIIDYVQLMDGSLDHRGANRNDVVTDISRRLKGLADECSVPIHLLSQLNRSAKDRTDKRPQLSDLRESGALEQDADNVGFLHRKNHKVGGTTQFILEKQRNGPCGTVNLTLERDCSRFVDGGEPEPEPSAEETQATAQRRRRTYAQRASGS